MEEIGVTPKSKMRETIVSFLNEFPLFDALRGEELKIVANYMNFVEIEKDGILFKEGDKGDYICFVLDGIIDVIKESSQGGSVVIASLPKGRSIGEMSVIDNSPRSATVKARTKTSLLTLTQKSLDTILKDHPEIGIKILKEIAWLLSQYLRKASDQLADLLLFT